MGCIDSGWAQCSSGVDTIYAVDEMNVNAKQCMQWMQWVMQWTCNECSGMQCECNGHAVYAVDIADVVNGKHAVANCSGLM